MKRIPTLSGLCVAMTALNAASASSAIKFNPPTPLYSCGQVQGMGAFQALDLDGDKKLDVIQYECIAFGNGDGTFRNPLTFSGQVIAAAADFNSDGKPDLITCNPVLGRLKNCALRVNLGSAKFAPPKDLSALNQLGDWSVSILSTSDLNGDGKMDLVAILAEIGPLNTSHEQLVVFRGDGRGGFLPLHGIADFGTGAVGFGGHPVEIADLNGDGRPDLALPIKDIDPQTGSLLNSINLYVNQGDFKFDSLKIKSSNENELLDPASIKSGDVNGDGLIDLVISDGGGINDYPGFFSIFINKGHLKFKFSKKQPGPNHPESVDLADLDRDGKCEILSPGGTDYPMNWIHSLGSPSIEVPAPTNMRSFFADINGDGKMDIVTSGYSSEVPLGFSVILRK